VPSTTPHSQSPLTELREKITRYFTDNDLKNLCFDLGMDYEDLPGETKNGKVRELVAHCERIDRIPELVWQCWRKYPHKDWGNIDWLIPYVTMAMTSDEASHFLSGNALNPSVTRNQIPSLAELAETLKKMGVEAGPLVARYGKRREDWMPCIHPSRMTQLPR
jgi:hypothetical protein